MTEIADICHNMSIQHKHGRETCISCYMQCSKVFLHNTQLVANDLEHELEHIPSVTHRACY